MNTDAWLKEDAFKGMLFYHLLTITIYALYFRIVLIFIFIFSIWKEKKLGIPSLVIYFVYPVVLIGASDLRNSRYLPVASLELLLAL